MGLWTPPSSFTAWQSTITAPSTYGVTTTAGSSAHTKNTTYTQIFASTDFDAYGIFLAFANNNANATNRSGLADIAIGAASSETVIIANLICGCAGNWTGGLAPGGQRYYFPLYIPAGSRLSVTTQNATASQTTIVVCTLFGKPMRPVWAGHKVTTYGANTATSRGVAVTSGVSEANGSWTEIVASSTYHHPYVAAGISLDGDTDVLILQGALDLGVGANGSEAVVSDANRMTVSSSEQICMRTEFACMGSHPPGTRFAARASVDDSAAQNFDVCLYGVS